MRSSILDPHEPPRGAAQGTRSTRSNFGLASGTALVVLWVCLCHPVRAQVHIEDLRVGFGKPNSGNEGNYKIGSWAPVRVKLRGEREGFIGVLELSTTDSDDVETVFSRPLSLSPNETIDDVTTFVMPGKQLPEYQVRLVDQAGKTRARASFDASSGRVSDGALQGITLIVTVGRPAGLETERSAERTALSTEKFRIAHLETARELPARWFGYEAVDHLVLCIDDPRQIEDLDLAHRASLEAWVKQGGQLVISVGTAWERVSSVLGPLLPAEFDRTVTVDQLKELESYLGPAAPVIKIRDALSIPHMTNFQGQIVAGTRELPLAVRAPVGLGTVTLIALELNREPFAGWDGRRDFWVKLLGLREQAKGSHQQESWAQRSLSDLSSYLRIQLEHFEGVKLVPFQWVAFFIFLYILLIGPVDYFLVKKVLKRMELTWVTFPTMVIGVSLVAYLAAYWLKGDKLRVNKIDVVDVDKASGELRGTSWFALFSPQIHNYNVRIEPALSYASSGQTQAGAPPGVLAWLGLAEDAIGGMSRQGSVGLFRRGYAFGPDAQTLLGVPVQVWSMKGFTARWHGKAADSVDANLQSLDLNRVKGTITNRLKQKLEDCVLVYGRKVYPIGDLPADGSVVVEGRTTEDLSGHLARKSGSFTRGNVAPESSRGQFNPSDLVFAMMFYHRLPEGGQTPANSYFSDIDLSYLLDHKRAIFVGRAVGKGSRLFLNDVEVDDDTTRVDFLRVILPVAPGDPQTRSESL